MTEPAGSAFDLQSLDGQALNSETIDRLSAVIPEDGLRAKRLRNLSRARQVIVASRGAAPCGLVYVRTIAGIPNVTWLVHESARRQGLAVRMLARLQRDWKLLTAICRNDASIGVARKAGFTVTGPLAIWIR
jgi:hypothetical protein